MSRRVTCSFDVDTCYIGTVLSCRGCVVLYSGVNTMIEFDIGVRSPDILPLGAPNVV